MALQSEVSPPMVGDPNTKIEGDTKSDDEEDSSQSSESDVDLEDGELPDSEAEEEKDFTNSSLKDALDESCLQNIEQLINQAKNAEATNSPTNHSKNISPHKMKRQGNYMDHDRTENSSEQNEGWCARSPKHKRSESKPIDYRNELEAYRGTPPSSPERKKSDKRRKRSKSSKKSKKSSRKAITRKDAKGHRVMRYRKDAARGKPCKYFKEGKCSKGADCPYSHNVPERYKKKELCKFYLSGHCNKGSHCVYMHGEFPCKFYHTGSVCYAKEDCRFSHEPLTDEMKKVLADYLRHVHGDRDHSRDDFIREDERDREHDRGGERERKRHRSRSPEPPAPPSEAPPPPKRVCLLGSPPRRIRESEETKRWQEEMKMLQQQNHPSFEISLMQDEEMDENMQAPFPRPNFYQETLLNSPQKQNMPVKQEMPDRLCHPPNFNHQNLYPPRNMNDNSPSNKVYVYDEDFNDVDAPAVKQEPMDEFDWDDSGSMNDVKPKLNSDFDENTHSDLDFSNDIKFDETTQFSEMESSVDGPPLLSENATPTVESKESDSEASNQDSNKHPKVKSEVEAPNTNLEPPAPPIVVPSHLPRKQRELFMRVQQHNQQKQQLPEVESVESQVKKECEDVEEEKEDSKADENKWYSSEDDDEDSDNLLTDVLKKIQQAPPPPKPVESKPAVNLMAMLNKIQQSTMEKSKTPTGTQQPDLLAPFLKGILGTVPAPTPPVSVPALSIPGASIIPDIKRRTLLPNPILPDNYGTKEILSKPPPMDPRLKNRDPRTVSAVTTSSNAVKQIVSDNNIGNSSPTLDSVLKPLSMFPNELPKDNVPYKLHGIYTRPPNYTPYLHASQANPTLLNDPRLRKHLQPTPKVEIPLSNGKEPEIISKPPPPKNVPPMPELLLKYEKSDSFINIFESNSSTKSSGNAQDIKHPLPMSAQRACDPRTIRRDSRSNSGSDTPPHLTIIETIKSPPQQEFKTAPVLDTELVEPVPEKKYSSPHALEGKFSPPLVLDKKQSPPHAQEKKHSPPHILEKKYSPPHILEKKYSPPHALEKKYSPPHALEKKYSPPHALEKKPSPPHIQEKKPLPPYAPEKSVTPPVLEKSDNLLIKSEPDSDSENSFDPPKLEFSGKTSFKKSPSPEREFIAIPKESPSRDGADLPIVPPLIIKKIKPTIASHLPRAIADPRMAKLHNPVDPRRHSKSLVERKTQPLTKLAAGRKPVESKNSSAASKSLSGETETVEKEEKQKSSKIPKKRRLSDKSDKNLVETDSLKSDETETLEKGGKPKNAKSIPKKRRLSDKSEEKKRTVHRNRKSSMDYASPLNSCDDAVPTSNSYNSYNQRPKRTTTMKSDKISNSSSSDISDNSSILSFLMSDSSNIDCDNSSDGNLKDRFKTIDPTASPFC